MPISDSSLRFLAFHLRIWERLTGQRKRIEFGEDLSQRSQRYLALLADGRPQWRQRLTILNMESDFDLLAEEHAVVPEVLELQLRLYSIAKLYPRLAAKLKREESVSSGSLLFCASLTLVERDGATGIAFDFTIGSDGRFPGFFLVNNSWNEAARISEQVISPAKSYFLRLSQLGYGNAREFIDESLPEYANAEIKWVSDNRFEFHFRSDEAPQTTDQTT